MSIKLLTEYNLEFLSFKGGCRLVGIYTSQNAIIVGNLMSWLIYAVDIISRHFCDKNNGWIRIKDLRAT